MIIKSHIRGGFRQAAGYLKDQGENEKVRLVEISDIDARNLDEAFQNMWAVASRSRAKKPLHHISINIYKDERLTDAQMLKIVERCEQKYGYRSGNHQRVIVEHIKDGRQHFHVMWNRVSLSTGKAVWPGHHWNKSKQVCREMEKELGLKSPVSRHIKQTRANLTCFRRVSRYIGHYQALNLKPHRGGKASGLVRQTLKTTNSKASPQIQRPKLENLSGMCEAQRIDFIAACEGKITWRQYFSKWGNSSGGRFDLE